MFDHLGEVWETVAWVEGALAACVEGVMWGASVVREGKAEGKRKVWGGRGREGGGAYGRAVGHVLISSKSALTTQRHSGSEL